MYLDKVKDMSDLDLVALIANLKPGDESVAQLAEAIAEGWSDGIRAEALRGCDAQPVHVARVEASLELASRLRPSQVAAANRTPVDRPKHYATTVLIDGDRLRHALWRRRLTLAAASRMLNRSESYMNVCISKGHMGEPAVDRLACELGVRFDELVAEIGTDEEVARLGVW